MPVNNVQSWQGKQYKWCEHFRDPFPIGKVGDQLYEVYLSSSRGFEKNFKNEEGVQTDFGIYLDYSWKRRLENKTSDVVVNLPADVAVPEFVNQWEYAKVAETRGIYLTWPDRGVVPFAKLLPLLAWMDEQIDAGKKLELACMGGHGRTGTLAAAILLYRRNKNNKEKLSAKTVIDFVRQYYCDEAIESDSQEDLLYELNGEPRPVRAAKTSTYSSYTPPSNKYPMRAGAAHNEIRKFLFNQSEVTGRLALDFTGTPREEVKEQSNATSTAVIVKNDDAIDWSGYYSELG